jgi:peptidoglycan/xylan/chitin deacetylase (PgdA/CDA1 family)
MHVLVILAYHDVEPHQVERFQWQIRKTQRAGTIISLSELGNRDFSKAIAITFDDGFANLSRTVIPYLKKNRIPAAFFLVPGNFGKLPDWKMNGPWPYKKNIIMDRNEVMELKDPLYGIGSHTFSHCCLTILSKNEIMLELLKSKRCLENIFGQEVNFLAFPYGAFSNDTIQIANECGYTTSFSLDSQIFLNRDQRVVGRISADPDDWKLEFLVKIRGGYGWIANHLQFKHSLESYFQRIKSQLTFTKEAIK